MSHEGLVIEGTLITPYFQRYQRTDDGFPPQGEILSRPDGAEDPSLFFSCLHNESHFTVLTWLLQLHGDLSRSHGVQASINVSNIILGFPPNRDRFLELFWQAQTPAVVEFTEIYRMPPVRTANRVLADLRLMGHRTALDDFGQRTSDFRLLDDYDFDIIKIDRSQISDLTRNPQRRAHLAQIFAKLDSLGRDHVVEGVEDEDTLAILQDMGFSVFQGFHFHVPEPLAALMASDGEDPVLQTQSSLG